MFSFVYVVVTHKYSEKNDYKFVKLPWQQMPDLPNLEPRI